MKQLGEFNRQGKVADAETETVTDYADLHDRSEIDGAPAPTDEELAAEVVLSGETASDEPASDSEAGEDAEAGDANADADLNGDGHDDETGEFVEGNQEAAN